MNVSEDLKTFWDLETIGIRKDEVSVYDHFIEDIEFEEGRYVVALPFKEDHPLLPDNFQISQKRLTSLLRRLQLKPNVLHEYNRIIKDQLEEGIIERVHENSTPVIGNHHYLPHHEVIRLDKETTKTRLVYDASARVNPQSPSLNDCLYAGPPLTPLIFDILVRFRLNKIAVIADIEKAFLNISIRENHRDFLRFLWVDQPSKSSSNINIYRFTRVVFGLTSSPFLLNATLRHHLSLFEKTDQDFVKATLKSLYVDDYASGFNCVEAALDQCKKVKSTLREGGFNLRKWNSNSRELLDLIKGQIEVTESRIENGFIAEDDQGYTQFTLNRDNGPCPKVLGICWNTNSDEFIFDFKKIIPAMETKDVTKRLVLSVAAKFYDPIGLISPIVLQFKLLFKKLCQENLNWDDSLDDDICVAWKSLLTELQKVHNIPVPRCYCPDLYMGDPEIELHAFGDASENAYGTCVYLRCQLGGEVHCNLIAFKTRVAPLTKQTIPRLELLACLISTQLVESIKKTFDGVLDINRVIYWSDSQVALSWIRNTTKEYKQFVQNRVLEIRRASSTEMWNYCPTSLNPADICSRGASPTEMIDNQIWWKGPNFVLLSRSQWPILNEPELPVDVDVEEKVSQVSTCLATFDKNLNLEGVFAIETFSSLSKLIRITALVLRFVRNLKLIQKNKNQRGKELSSEELFESERLWIQNIQFDLKSKPNFRETRHSLNVFEDDFGIFHCRGRMENKLPYETNCPALLPSEHHFTKLVILKAHACVMHNGTQETLAQVRSKYWIVKGRQIVKKILSKCNTCKRLEGRSYGVPHAPPLPSFRVSDDFAFSSIGVDYAGPLYVKDIYSDSGDMNKVYIVLYTCASSRAVHLDLAPDASSVTFVRSLKRFIGRRGVPSFVISDNGKTFKSNELKSFVLSKGISWKYNVELSPWWGGFFERMVRSVKRCLKKTLGTARLTFEELLTLLIEVEGILNSRPLTYLGEEYGEPLTPSHLVVGRRLLSEPDVLIENRVPNSVTDSEMTKRILAKSTESH